MSSSLTNFTPHRLLRPISAVAAAKSSPANTSSLSPISITFKNSISMASPSPVRSSVKTKFTIKNTSSINNEDNYENYTKRREKVKESVVRVGLICGGPSMERGISLNSARSVLDHIQGDDLKVSCYYIDLELNANAISSAQLYSNTPADFDFKLESLAQGFSCLSDFVEHLAASVDIVFPVIHGPFGEDGTLQELLERANIPFVGTRSRECRKAFDKHEASLELDRNGFLTVPSFLVQVLVSIF